MAKKSNAQKIREYMLAHPTAKPADVASKFGVKPQYIYVLRNQMKKKRLNALSEFLFNNDAPAVDIDLVHAGEENKEADMVNHPPHYTAGGVETIKFIEAKGLDYHLGNVVKYITRAGKKDDEIQDLKKARWYLERAINVRENPAYGLV